MNSEEDQENMETFVKLVDSIKVDIGDFDIHRSYEYFNSHSQTVTTYSEGIRQYAFVILTLKTIIASDLHKYISQVYLNDLVNYIEGAEFEKNWYDILQNNYYLPSTTYFLETLKYELVQYSIHDSMYVLRLKCMTFHEEDVKAAYNIACYFFSECIDREVSLAPQIKWKFSGNPFTSIIWILAIPKYTMDNFTGYKRKLLNECWNDYYGGNGWRSCQTKKRSLMDYMKQLSGFKGGKDQGNAFQRLVSRTNSFFEIDDTIFAKFSEDKDVYRRRSLFSFSAVLICAIFIVILWIIYRKLC